jgi:hypothetical protein
VTGNVFVHHDHLHSRPGIVQPDTDDLRALRPLKWSTILPRRIMRGGWLLGKPSQSEEGLEEELASLYSPECVEGVFCELRHNGVLRSSGMKIPLEGTCWKAKIDALPCPRLREHGARWRVLELLVRVYFLRALPRCGHRSGYGRREVVQATGRRRRLRRRAPSRAGSGNYSRTTALGVVQPWLVRRPPN